MNETEDGTVPGTAQTVKKLLPRAGQRQSIVDRPIKLLANPSSIVALVMLHGIGLVLWMAASFGLLTGVPAPGPNHVQLLAVLLPLEAVLLCTLVLARQGRMDRLAEERSRLSLQAALLLEAEMTDALQQLARINARLGIGPGSPGSRR